MGSIQQVAMAGVCLAAAFAFGSFINQAPNQQPNQTAQQSPDQLRSLIEDDLPVQVHKGTAKTPWMKTLSARLPMPSLSNDSVLSDQTVTSLDQPSSSVDEIPPPSDLTGRTGVPTNDSTPVLITPRPTALASNAPTFGSDSRSESSMPRVAPQKFGSSPNLADSMRAPSQPAFDAPPQTPIENAPVFVAADYTDTDTETIPTSQDLRSGSYRAAKPRLPNRTMRPIEPAQKLATQPTSVMVPEMSFEKSAPINKSAPIAKSAPTTKSPPIANNPFGRRFDHTDDRQQSRNDGLMPIPRIKQPVTITDPGGAFGNRDSQLEWRHTGKATIANNNPEYYPEANRQQPTTQQHRVARLPLQLNSNAKSKLTRLRDNTIQKISLSTTQFSEHVVERGDSLQSIASKYFGKPDFYLDIYLANRDRLRYPGDIREGMTIKIPVYQ